MNFIVYEATGAIRRSGQCPASMLAQQMGLDEFIIEGEADDLIQYVNTTTHTLTDKQLITPVLNKTTMIADGIDAITMSGLPLPCIVNLDGTTYSVPDGSLVFSVDLPGKYVIGIDSSPQFLPHELTVLAQ